MILRLLTASIIIMVFYLLNIGLAYLVKNKIRKDFHIYIVYIIVSLLSIYIDKFLLAGTGLLLLGYSTIAFIYGFSMNEIRITREIFLKRDTWILLLIFFTPVLDVFGTANSLLFQATFLLATLLVLIVNYVKSNPNLLRVVKLYLLINLFLFSLFHLIQVKDGSVKTVFSIKEKIDNCSFTKGIFVDLELKTLVENTGDILASNNYNGEPLFVFYLMPGLNVLLDAPSPIGPIWSKQAISLTNYRFGFLGSDLKDKCFIITENESDKDMLLCLQSNGINFPADFSQIGATSYKGIALKVFKPLVSKSIKHQNQ